MASCGSSSVPSSSALSSSGSLTNESSSSLESTSQSSSESEVQTTIIAAVRSGQIGSSFTVRGVVVCMNFTGQTAPYLVGYWIADTSDSIYVYVVPNDAILSGKTIEEIVSTKPADNHLSSLLYRVSAKVCKSEETYPSYSLQDVNDNDLALPLYSRNSGADYAWLDSYLNKNVNILVGIQNHNLKAAVSNWRGIPIQVIGEIS